MKNIKYLLASISFILLFGCNEVLNILPDDKPILDDAFKDAQRSENYLFTCYRYLPPVADPLTSLGLTGGGEIYYSPLDVAGSLPSGQPGPMKAFFEGNQVNNPFMNYWDGGNGAPVSLWQGIRDCNVFLEKIPIENGGPQDVDEETRTQWIAEVKTLKAIYHYILFQLYGPIPIVDQVIPISAKGDDVNVYREPVDEVANYIVSTLDEAIADLPTLTSLDNSTEYGRMTKSIAWAIKAKTLVLAASPIFNNNSNYSGVVDNRGISLFPAGDSQQRWEMALAACDSACRVAEEAGAKILISTDGGGNAISGVNSSNINDTTKAIISMRQAVTESWNPEVIWASNENTSRIQIYSSALGNSEWNNAQGAGGNELGQRHGPTLDAVERFYSSNGIPIQDDKEWVDNGWYINRYTTQVANEGNSKYLMKEGQKTALLHFNRSLRFYASVGFQGGLWEGGGKSISGSVFPDFRSKKGSGEKTYGGYGNFPPTGYLVKKLCHLETTYSANRINLVEERYSFPVIRLADLYLLLAECLNEVGGPSLNDSQGRNAYSYLDEIRERSGMKGVVESWSNYAIEGKKDKPQSQNGLREIIRTERFNELAFEGAFYFDVRRWLMAEDILNRPTTGWNYEGETHLEFFNVRVHEQPRFSTKDYLMPIQTNTMLQNPNLVQNYGW